MIYDCFLFFNELDLLEIRLLELAAVVDRFVLVEATKTFQGAPKPLFFAQHRDRFANFLDRIIHVVVDEEPEGLDAWGREHYQRNQMVRGLVGCDPDDVVLISDLDEIPRPSAILDYQDEPGIKALMQDFYYYFLNCKSVYFKWPWGTRMVYFRDLTTPQDIRNHEDVTRVINGGWHFSFLGGVDRIIEKLEAFSHTEFNADYYKDPLRLRAIIEAGQDLFDRDLFDYEVVPLDESFPEVVLRRRSDFSHLIREVEPSR